MNEFNRLPENSKIIEDYSIQKIFFGYQIEHDEFRQVLCGESALDGVFNLRVFWINKEKGLAFGIADNEEEKRLDWYLIGSDKNWCEFSKEFAIRFKGDNT